MGRFPDPADIPRTDSPYRILDLRTLIELKPAAGMSTPDPLQDLADVLSLVRANKLPESCAEALDASVREKYRELWQAALLPHRDL